jgi:putative iron-dependent peroxidase
MPFGRPAEKEFGTYFIGYCRSPRPIEQMLENMFIGRPPGNYDRLLDFSRATTGSLFFVPSATFLDEVADMTDEATPDATTQTAEVQSAPAEPSAAPSAAEDSQVPPVHSDGSLGIGSLKGDFANE